MASEIFSLALGKVRLKKELDFARQRVLCWQSFQVTFRKELAEMDADTRIKMELTIKGATSPAMLAKLHK